MRRSTSGSTDPIGSFTDIFENVIQHFTAQYGTRVSLTLDIEAALPAASTTARSAS
jgi:hypothetical protein